MKLKNNKKLKTDILKLSDIVRKKYLALKLNKKENDEVIKDFLKPLSSPIHDIAVKTNTIAYNINKTPVKIETKEEHDEETEENEFQTNADVDTVSSDNDHNNDIINGLNSDCISPTAYENYLQDYGPITREYIDHYLNDHNKEFDHSYGVNHDSELNKWSIGSSNIDFHSNSNDFTLNGSEYTGTRGLYELMFKSIPKNFTPEYKEQYKKILLSTNLHKRNFDPNNQLPGSTNYKYKNSIKELIKNQDTFSGSAYKSEQALIQYNSKPVEYRYWNDINELIDRLRLLVASKQAGNNSLDNEIYSLEQELREEKIIE